MSVVAQVRRDVGEVWRRARAAEIRGELVESDDARRAHRAVDDRVEVDERVVARGVLVAGAGLLGVVGGADRRVATGPRLRRRVADVLHVALPCEAPLGELVRKGRNVGGEDAAGADRLPVGGRGDAPEVGEHRAVGLRLRIRSLAADLREVVRQAVVRDAVVVVEELSLREQRSHEILRRRASAEGVRVALVLEVDHEDVPDGRQAPRTRRRGRRTARARGRECCAGSERGRDGCGAARDHAALHPAAKARSAKAFQPS